MAITDKLSAIADSMREADGSSRTYNMVEMAERPAVWQQTIAEAITAKGVDTLPDASFDTMAVNIGLLGGGDFAMLRKEINFASQFSSGDVFFATQTDLINAGILDNTGQAITDVWENIRVDVHAKEGALSHLANVMFKSEMSSDPIMVLSTTKWYKLTMYHQSSASNISYKGDAKGLNEKVGGSLFADENGVQFASSTSYKIGVGTYIVEVYVSGRK